MSTPLIPYYAHVDVYSHGFRVYKFDDRVRRLCVDFCMRYVERQFQPIGRGRFEQKISKVYAAATATRDQYFFHRGHYEEFMAHLRMNYVGADKLFVTQVPMYEPIKVEYVWSDPNRTPHDYQRLIIDFFLQLLPRAKVATLQTGKGKTFSTIASIYEMASRACMVLPAKYMDMWKQDVRSTLGLKPGELVTVNGAKEMRLLIALAKQDDFDAKVILISNTTYRMFLRDFFDFSHQDNYGVKPWEFFELLKAAPRVVDEVHEHFHLNWIIDCMTNVYKSISLSATLVSDDMFKNSLYNTMFPSNTHAPVPAYDKYIDVYSIAYRIRENQRIRFMNAMKQYSQVMYEQSIRKYPAILKNYIKMVLDIVQAQHFDHPDYKPGMKTAVFFGLTDMCDDVAKALQAKYPELKVRRFIAEDPEEFLKDGDIIVTTLQSCGTGKDIPDLATGFSLIALSNKQANEQLVGRLRRLKKWPEVTPRFYFLYNNENGKHCTYRAERKEKLKMKMRSFNELISEFII